MSFRKRTNAKGKRWAKGQSSSSNPVNRKFRDGAMTNFFANQGTVPTNMAVGKSASSALTVETLKKHDNMIYDESCNNSAPSECGSLAQKSVASAWTTCTNALYSKFINNANLSSALDKAKLACLDVIHKTILEEGGSESNLEYFVAMMNALDYIDVKNEDAEMVCALYSLISNTLSSIPPAAFKKKFDLMSKILKGHLQYYAEAENYTILKYIFKCLLYLLKAQEPSVWEDNYTLALYDDILKFVDHEKSKIRKTVHNTISSILVNKNRIDDELHPASKHTGKNLIEKLNNCITNSWSEVYTTFNYVLNLLKEIIGYLPKSELKVICDKIFTVMTKKDRIVIFNVLSVIKSLFACSPHPNHCPADLNGKIISFLLLHKPIQSDVQSMSAWFGAIQEIFVNLSRIDLSLCMDHAVEYFKVCCKIGMTNQKKTIVDNCAISLRTLIVECLQKAALEENVAKFEAHINTIFQQLNKCLEEQYHIAHKQILHLFNHFYRTCGKTCYPFMMNTLKSLAKRRDQDGFQYADEIDNIFGSAISSIGPELIITNIPLEIDENCNVGNAWLLPLMKKFIKNSSLRCFANNFQPIAVQMGNLSNECRKKKDENGAAIFSLTYQQLWALFPAFCDGATDISQAFPSLARKMAEVLKNNEDLRLTIMACLRNLIKTSEGNADDTAVVARYAENYLPVLFNFYLGKCVGDNPNTDQSDLNACLDTIKPYLALADPNYVAELLSKLHEKLNSDKAKDDAAYKESVMELLIVTVPYQSVQMLSSLFQYASQGLSNKSLSMTEKKKLYKLLEKICSCGTENANSFVSNNIKKIIILLLKTNSIASPPHRGLRVRIIRALIRYRPRSFKLMIKFLPEVVMSCKEVNKQCREDASALIAEFALKRVEKKEEAGLHEFLDSVSVGLQGNVTMMSATISALTSIVYHCKDHIDKEKFDDLFKNICILCLSNTQEIVGPAIGFAQTIVNIKQPNLLAGDNLDLLVKTLSDMKDVCKRKFRQKYHTLVDRLVRKFGVGEILARVPTHDAIFFKRLKNLKKEHDRKERKRKEERIAKVKGKSSVVNDPFKSKSLVKSIDDILAEECDSEDEKKASMDVDESDDEIQKRPKKKAAKRSGTKLYIQETEDDIIDFSSEMMNKNLLVGRLKSTDGKEPTGRVKSTFETTEDGRLIIKDEKDEKKIPKIEQFHSDDDDENDIGSDAEAEQNSIARRLNQLALGKKRKATDNDGEEPSKKYRAGGSGIHRPIGVSKKKDKKDGEKYTQKGKKVEPYSYIPLSRNSLNKRNKNKFKFSKKLKGKK